MTLDWDSWVKFDVTGLMVAGGIIIKIISWFSRFYCGCIWECPCLLGNTLWSVNGVSHLQLTLSWFWRWLCVCVCVWCVCVCVLKCVCLFIPLLWWLCRCKFLFHSKQVSMLFNPLTWFPKMFHKVSIDLVLSLVDLCNLNKKYWFRVPQITNLLHLYIFYLLFSHNFFLFICFVFFLSNFLLRYCWCTMVYKFIISH